MRQLIICLMGLTLFSFILSCQKEVSQEFGEPAKGSLQSDLGECLPKLVAGSYIVNKALNDSNFIEVTVNVATPGSYTIATDSLEGFSFKATGAFTTAGPTTVRLKASGVPQNSGTTTFRVSFDSSTCDVDVTILPDGATGGPAIFTLAGAPGACAPFTPAGNYYKDTTLDARHSVSVQVNVATVGTYTISTTTQNGYSFSHTGTFGATGVQTVKLEGTGKPAAVGTDNFSVTAGTSTCTFSINVTAPPAGCTPTVEGTYTAGTVTTATNRILVNHTYATAGSYTVSTAAVNGYSFGPKTITATAGANAITLEATGTPTQAGTNTFTINFGDGQTCTFTVTVNNGTAPPPNTDYFPTTLNSWWSYSEGSDTFRITNVGPVALGGNTYQRFVADDRGTAFDSSYFRKNGNDFYEYIDTSWFGLGAFGLKFTTPGLDVLFLKNSLATGDSLVSNFNASLDTGGTVPVPVIFRVKYKVINANATVTVNGNTFTNVYQLRDSWEIGFMGNFIDLGAQPWDYFYARGVGRIKTAMGGVDHNIRYWRVN